jgi:hypothetical protein
VASVIGWRVWLETATLPAEWRRPISVLQLGVYVFALRLGWLVNSATAPASTISSTSRC